jgi:phospholipid/cholesterol/gamma-HCH transport system substrate-binding protein
MKLAKETKIGIVAFIALLVLIIGYNLLRGVSLFRKDVSLYAVYENASGLNRTDPVVMHGFEVGMIQRVELKYISNFNPSVIIRFSVKKDVKIPVNSVARIVSTDLLGSKAILIVPGDIPVLVQSGDTLKGEIEIGLTEAIASAVSPLQQRTVDLIASLDTLITVFNQVLNQEGRENIESSFRNVALTLQNLQSTTASFDRLVKQEGDKMQRILTNVENITNVLSTNQQNFDRIISNMGQFSDSLAASDVKNTVDRANIAIREVETIIQTINRGEGSLGLLLQNEQLYRNLELSSRSLDRLLVDIRRNPGRYLNVSLINIGGGKEKAKPAE